MSEFNAGCKRSKEAMKIKVKFEVVDGKRKKSFPKLSSARIHQKLVTNMYNMGDVYIVKIWKDKKGKIQMLVVG